MISKSLILLWLCGTLFISTVGVGFYAIKQTVRIASLTAELTNSATELAATKAYHAKEPYWLADEAALIAAKQATARLEQDPWVEVIFNKLCHVAEVTIREAFELCFDNFDVDDLTRAKSRRMGRALLMANWIKNGKFTAGTRRNQVRFVNQSELIESSDNFEF
jgi:hypothetical protein